MSDPLSNIEDKKAQVDMGIFGARIYEGALEESGNRFNAMVVTFAFFYGMFKGNRNDPPVEDGT
jgi:hypothetical protein